MAGTKIQATGYIGHCERYNCRQQWIFSVYSLLYFSRDAHRWPQSRQEDGWLACAQRRWASAFVFTIGSTQYLARCRHLAFLIQRWPVSHFFQPPLPAFRRHRCWHNCRQRTAVWAPPTVAHTAETPPALPLPGDVQARLRSSLHVLSTADISTAEHFLARRYELSAEIRRELARKIAEPLLEKLPYVQPDDFPDLEIFLQALVQLAKPKNF